MNQEEQVTFFVRTDLFGFHSFKDSDNKREDPPFLTDPLDQAVTLLPAQPNRAVGRFLSEELLKIGELADR